MSRSGNGTSDGLLVSLALAPPFSMACWFRPDLDQNGTLMAACSSASVTGFFGLRVRGDVAGDPLEAIQQEATPGSTGAAQVNGVALSTWQHGLAVFTSNSSRAVYLNGSGATNTTAVGSATPDRLSALYSARGGTPSAYFGGQVAHAAVWSAALDATEAAQLAAGANPAEVRKASLVGYWRLAGFDSPEPNMVSGGSSLAVSGATAGATNPGVWVPWRRRPTTILLPGAY
jgi:hypothetical protein